VPLPTMPSDVVDVLHRFRTCELTTLTKTGHPVTWPVTTHLDEEAGTFLASTSLGFPAKARNVERDARVSLLYSNATASGLDRPPTVLVQGEASASPVTTDVGAWEPLLEKVMRFQPKSREYHTNALTRKLADWYFMRVLLTVQPRRITWWPDGDRGRAPEVVDVR
jgi:hypothetical protein